MNMAVTFTPVQLFSVTLAICGAIITLSGALTALAKWISKLREPEDRQNERITNIELLLAKHDEYLSRDKARLDRLEFGNEAIQEALLALLDHALNENNKKGLSEAKEKLQKYLIHPYPYPQYIDSRAVIDTKKKDG